jgi:hypothetical protein
VTSTSMKLYEMPLSMIRVCGFLLSVGVKTKVLPCVYQANRLSGPTKFQYKIPSNFRVDSEIFVISVTIPSLRPISSPERKILWTVTIK